MFRIGQHLPVVVVAPVPWFPFQSIIRIWQPGFRVSGPRHEVQSGFDVYRPRFLSAPGIFKQLDGFLMALGSVSTMIKLGRRSKFEIIDAHFAYPEGYAATLLGKWFSVPVTITLRGTERRLVQVNGIRGRLIKALHRARRVFSVSNSLKELAGELGIDSQKIVVVPNGVDTDRFSPVDQSEARRKLDLPMKIPVLISVGALVERKGFHRVIELLPQLRQEFHGLMYLVVGGASAEGDWTLQLSALAESLNVSEAVRFLGEVPPDELKLPLSAADVFVLATRNEGWANVLLEAMSCGLPAVTTDVGGNREVVSEPYLGTIVQFDDQDALLAALRETILKNWDRNLIRGYAEKNTWNRSVDTIVGEFRELSRSQMTGTGTEPVRVSKS